MNDKDVEIIKICQFPMGYHYYLLSNKDRVFKPEKYENFNEAYDVAVKIIGNINIIVENPNRFRHKNKGD